MVIMVKSNTVCINPELDERFRDCISKAYPQKRGNRKRAAEEAIKEWCIKIETRKLEPIAHPPLTKEQQEMADDYNKHHPSATKSMHHKGSS